MELKKTVLGLIIFSAVLLFSYVAWTQVNTTCTPSATSAWCTSGSTAKTVAGITDVSGGTTGVEWQFDGTGTLTAGSIPDARLTANIPLLNVVNVFNANQDMPRAVVGVQAAQAANPAANKVTLYIDESTNRTGAAPADCALVARQSDGTETLVATLVTDAGCS